MNCECIKEVKARVREHVTPQFKKPIKDIGLLGQMLTMPDCEMITCSTLVIELEGQKKKAEINIAHSFCPFCGVKIKKDKKPKEVN